MAATRRLLVFGAAAYLGALSLNRALVVVQGGSMEPTLWPGDRLLTVPAARPWLRTGSVVVLRDPTDARHLVVKRLIEFDAETADVRGDGADHSTDSRTWGRIPVVDIRRIVVVRWPDVRTTVRSRRRGQPTTRRAP